MKNKRNIVIVLFILLLILILWFSGIIPKQIAKFSATYHFKKHFPKIQMEYESIEWDSNFGSYIIKFKDENNKLHGFCIGPKYFPINLSQGLFGFEEEYWEKYSE